MRLSPEAGALTEVCIGIGPGRLHPPAGRALREKAKVDEILDLDFANIRAHPAEHSGIIVLRLKRQDKATVLGYVMRLAAALANRARWRAVACASAASKLNPVPRRSANPREALSFTGSRLFAGEKLD